MPCLALEIIHFLHYLPPLHVAVAFNPDISTVHVKWVLCTCISDPSSHLVAKRPSPRDFFVLPVILSIQCTLPLIMNLLFSQFAQFPRVFYWTEPWQWQHCWSTETRGFEIINSDTTGPRANASPNQSVIPSYSVLRRDETLGIWVHMRVIIKNPRRKYQFTYILMS